jgi:hypothetical protein
LSLINSSIDIGVGMTLGTDVSGRTIDDVKNELLKKLILIKELAKDPFIQEKVGEAAKEVIDLSIETLDEVEKPAHLKGKYLHPLQYGKTLQDAAISVKSPLQKEVIKAEGNVEQKPLGLTK